MTYGSFAQLYDELMLDVPYDKWIELIGEQAQKYGINGKKVLDLACGTGEISIKLAKAGYDVTGVDLSAEMLTVAREKAEDSGQSIFFAQQDMSKLEGLGQFDIIGIFCDSLNYLESEEMIINTFEHVYNHLQPSGLLIFDVHSLYKMNELFIGNTYAYNGDEISYIWQCFEGEKANSVEHELTFFVLDENDHSYHRHDEMHYQRTFSIEQYQEWLISTGFNLLNVTADYQEKKPQMDSERIFFIAKK